MTRAIADEVLAAFDAVGGVAWLIQMAEKRPEAFAKLLARLVPQSHDLRVDTGPRVLVARVTVDRDGTGPSVEQIAAEAEASLLPPDASAQ